MNQQTNKNDLTHKDLLFFKSITVHDDKLFAIIDPPSWDINVRIVTSLDGEHWSPYYLKYPPNVSTETLICFFNDMFINIGCGILMYSRSGICWFNSIAKMEKEDL